MIADTLWQKYIYSTPFDDSEIPLLNSRMLMLIENTKTAILSARGLYKLDEVSFEKTCDSFYKSGYGNVIIVDDYHFKSRNQIVLNGAKAHMLSFCYLFQKKGFRAIIFEGEPQS